MRLRLTLLIGLLIVLILGLAALQLERPSQRSGHITLLTVAEGGQERGGVADLYLEIEPGEGKVFIDSFPLTRLDTQGSTRYANQIACDYVDADCSRYDFFYTIRANSAIVGGPSAGGAMAVLTAALLENRPLRQNIAMTGTINSGGIIGPVAGIPQKVEAAGRSGITLVLVPSLGNFSNITDGQARVVGVSELAEALEHFTGASFEEDLPPLEVTGSYEEIMGTIAEEICARSTALAQQAPLHSDPSNYTARIAALGEGRAYSRASLCFSRNIELNELVVGNLSGERKEALAQELRSNISSFREEVKREEIATINDLEAYEIAMERLLEAEELLSGNSSRRLAYAQERYLSAVIWSRFFSMEGPRVELDPAHLERACLSKISEADERINYLKLYAPALAQNAEATLEDAYAYSASEPILCVFTASKAKAQANLVASALALPEESVDLLVDEKLRAGSIVLRRQQREGFFPILGYSYHQYAADLQGPEPFSALTFAEYALELSNLDLYFPEENGFQLPARFVETMLFFLYGALFGCALTILLAARRLFRK